MLLTGVSMRKDMKIRFVLILFFLSGAILSQNYIYIRTNQLAFLPEDSKSAVVMANRNLTGKTFYIVDKKNNKNVYKSKINSLFERYGRFKYTAKLDFSSLNQKGEYYIKIGKTKSYPFFIGTGKYDKIVKSLLEFFKIQRCGYTNPKMHKTCHIADATSLIENGKKINEQIDVTGGWHDAGDYVKFLNTTAYSTYMLLFAYEYNKKFFSFDLNKNNVPDILDEAKIGLDWLLRCQYKNKLVVQVQDLRDHTVGWRMPENDTLRFSRPAFIDIGKNLIGIYSASLALAAKIWQEDILYPDYAQKCIKTAEKYFRLAKTAPDIAKAGSGMYVDSGFEGKLALGAVELYRVTRKLIYLKKAKEMAAKAGADGWWSWGNINSLAHYRISRFDRAYLHYLRVNLEGFLKMSKTNLFGEGAAYSWGTNNTLLGVSLQNILYTKRTGSREFEKLSLLQRDYVLGRNPWGISFFYKIGKNYSRNFHHQVAFLSKRGLPGGFAAGPVKKELLKSYSIPFAKKDRLAKFQTDFCYYRDDKNDYISNEPTITAAATAIFVMGYFASK